MSTGRINQVTDQERQTMREKHLEEIDNWVYQNRKSFSKIQFELFLRIIKSIRNTADAEQANRFYDFFRVMSVNDFLTMSSSDKDLMLVEFANDFNQKNVPLETFGGEGLAGLTRLAHDTAYSSDNNSAEYAMTVGSLAGVSAISAAIAGIGFFAARDSLITSGAAVLAVTAGTGAFIAASAAGESAHNNRIFRDKKQDLLQIAQASIKEDTHQAISPLTTGTSLAQDYKSPSQELTCDEARAYIERLHTPSKTHLQTLLKEGFTDELLFEVNLNFIQLHSAKEEKYVLMSGAKLK